MKDDQARVRACTTPKYSGVIAMMRPGSFVTRYNGLEKRMPGFYALRVYGRIPDHIRRGGDEMEEDEDLEGFIAPPTPTGDEPAAKRQRLTDEDQESLDSDIEKLFETSKPEAKTDAAVDGHRSASDAEAESEREAHKSGSDAEQADMEKMSGSDAEQHKSGSDAEHADVEKMSGSDAEQQKDAGHKSGSDAEQADVGNKSGSDAEHNKSGSDAENKRHRDSGSESKEEGLPARVSGSERESGREGESGQSGRESGKSAAESAGGQSKASSASSHLIVAPEGDEEFRKYGRG